VVLAVLGTLLLHGPAGSAPEPLTALAGEWRGTSLCVDLARAPNCKDEIVRYTFTPASDGRSAHLVADKIVAGRFEPMGEMDVSPAGGEWRYELRTRSGEALRWSFRPNGRRLAGELTRAADGARLRAVEAARPEGPAANVVTSVNAKDRAEMSLVPAGTFLMGTDERERRETWRMFGWDAGELAFTSAEGPAHRLRLDAFHVYRTLVTVAQFRRYCAEARRAMPSAPSYGWRDDRPMVNETWAEASAYCEWAGGRLPTEAEWEYAARGGHTGVDGWPRTVFVWGDELPAGTRVANLADETFVRSGYYRSPGFVRFAGYEDGAATASAVRAFPANGFGLFDMAGNVLEWCWDWFADDYYARSPAANPRGPSSGERRVLRGGAFDTIPTITRIARRLGSAPTVRHEEKGFRCVVDGRR
jgi:formylglycine-generating enzyme required for sulfatase activity